jgi:hypothetical protein
MGSIVVGEAINRMSEGISPYRHFHAAEWPKAMDEVGVLNEGGELPMRDPIQK